MNDRADSNFLIPLIVGILLIVLLGGFGYMMFARRHAIVIEQTQRAVAAAAAARLQADQARRQAELPMEKSSKGDQHETAAAVETMLQTQQEAWNAGDIDSFMQHYWQSDDLTFSSAGQTTRGWQATIERYRERYPTREKMGQLTFEGLEVTPISESAALVLGRWQLQRDDTPLQGNFSLVVRKIGGRWLIIHDHTSRLDE